MEAEEPVLVGSAKGRLGEKLTFDGLAARRVGCRTAACRQHMNRSSKTLSRRQVWPVTRHQGARGLLTKAKTSAVGAQSEEKRQAAG